MADRPRFQEAADLDRGLALYGARAHLWRPLPPLPLPWLTEVEAAIGTRLPPRWRHHLTTVSAGGAGPLWGLQVPRPPDDPSLVRRPFPGLDAVHRRFREAGVDFDDGYHEVWDVELQAYSIQGTLPLAAEGCGHHRRVVVHGHEAGSVLFVANEGGVHREADDVVTWIHDDLDDRIGPLRRLWARMRAREAADTLVTVADAHKVATLLGQSVGRSGSGRDHQASARTAYLAWLDGAPAVGLVDRLDATDQALLAWRDEHLLDVLLAGVRMAIGFDERGPRLTPRWRRGTRSVHLRGDRLHLFDGTTRVQTHTLEARPAPDALHVVIEPMWAWLTG